MQFSVPQFVDVEDKIIGPLTLKQFLVLLVGGVIIFVLKGIITNLFLLILASIPVGGIAVVIAFGKVNGRSFGELIFSASSYVSDPRSFVFRKDSKINEIKVTKEDVKKTQNEGLSRGEKLSRLNKITYILDQDIKKERELIDEKFVNLK